MDADAVIIGGGVSGLACAYGLKKAGKRCVVLESGTLGGVAVTERVDGFQCELGPNVFLERPGFRPLLIELGLADEMVYPRVRRYGQYIWFGEKAEPLPKSFGAFLSSPLIPGFDKLALLRGVAALLLPGYLRCGEDGSVADFFGRILGRRTIERMLDPAMKGVYGGDVSLLSARSVFPELWRHTAAGGALYGYLKAKKRSPIFVLRGGAARLGEALAAHLSQGEVLRDKAVRILARSSNCFEIATAGSGSVRTPQVFVATSGHQSAPYLAELCPELAAALLGLRYAAITVVHCAVARTAPIHRDGFGTLFPGGRKTRLLGVMYNSELFPHIAPPDAHLLTLCFGGREAQQFCEQSDEYFGQSALEELAATLHVTGARVLRVTRWSHAIPQYELGHWRMVQMMRDVERRMPGLYFTGSDTGGIAVPDRVLRSLACVQDALSAPGGERGA